MPPLPAKYRKQATGAVNTDGPQWDEYKISAVMEDNSVVKVKAAVYGTLAVHKSLEKKRPGMFSVTAVRCGLWVCDVREVKDAVRVAEYLFGKCFMAFHENEQEAVNAKIPDWVKKWVRACRERFAWVDPKPFEKGR